MKPTLTFNNFMVLRVLTKQPSLKNLLKEVISMIVKNLIVQRV